MRRVLVISVALVLALSVAGLLAVAGCGDGDTGEFESTGDTISITSVAPDSGLSADTATDFVVTVQYELVSAESGELGIGFNSVEAGRYQMIVDAKTVIAQGSGGHTFNVSVVTKDWGDEDFVAYVNLSEYPHEHTWSPLATDTEVLTLR